jgi:NAD(P)-dependent dehydrogenase (short-subunit alcohol dehydrogenase family)
MTTNTALIIGAGDATGGAIARRFAREGLVACVVRRQGDRLVDLVRDIEAGGGQARAFPCDARDEQAMTALFDRVEREVGPLDVVVFNAGAFIHAPRFPDMSGETFRASWEITCFAGFLTGREAARHMVQRGRGTILVTGATASMRGGKGFAAFASAKFGLRALAQSMARELGPQGIHVAHVVIDGVIDTPQVDERFPGVRQDKGEDGLLSPDAIAETYWHLHTQPRSAWTHELDLRPWAEKW